MHMGFDDPAFGGQMPSRGGVRGGGGMGGARWDPIAPPGMQVCPMEASCSAVLHWTALALCSSASKTHQWLGVSGHAFGDA